MRVLDHIINVPKTITKEIVLQMIWSALSRLLQVLSLMSGLLQEVASCSTATVIDVENCSVTITKEISNQNASLLLPREEGSSISSVVDRK